MGCECTRFNPSPGSLRSPPSPLRGEGKEGETSRGAAELRRHQRQHAQRAARALLDLERRRDEQRDVNGWGVEAVGTDHGQAFAFEPAFPAHHLMHGANKFGLASLTNLDQLPPTGAVVIAPPLKIVNGSGSPLRVLALVPV